LKAESAQCYLVQAGSSGGVVSRQCHTDKS